MCLVSSLPVSACPEQVYQLRPWIETLFGNQKSRGFNLARTHLTIPEQIDRLFLALAIATCMLLGLGTHIFITRQTKWVDRSDRRDLSLFQLGFRSLLRFLTLNWLHTLFLRKFGLFLFVSANRRHFYSGKPPQSTCFR